MNYNQSIKILIKIITSLFMTLLSHQRYKNAQNLNIINYIKKENSFQKIYN